jgi:hypothetical protein
MQGGDFGGRPATASPPGDDRGDSSADHAETEAVDPIRTLIARLDSLANYCGSVPLRDGGAMQVARCAGGFAVGLRT